MKSSPHRPHRQLDLSAVETETDSEGLYRAVMMAHPPH